jgi:hypothetical protein
MYAVSTYGRVYHLLYPFNDYTLCGFRALKFSNSNGPARLRLASAIPPNRSLCKQCEKMAQRRTRAQLPLDRKGGKSEKMGE